MVILVLYGDIGKCSSSLSSERTDLIKATHWLTESTTCIPLGYFQRTWATAFNQRGEFPDHWVYYKTVRQQLQVVYLHPHEVSWQQAECDSNESDSNKQVFDIE